MLSYGGLPLIYLGDEIGTLNDYRYQQDAAKAGDSRWAHRPVFDGSLAELRHEPRRVQGRIFNGLLHLIELRKQEPAFARGIASVDTGNPQVLGFAHYHATGPLLVLANFSEFPQAVPAEILHAQGFSWSAKDLITGTHLLLREGVPLSPYQLAWLKPM